MHEHTQGVRKAARISIAHKGVTIRTLCDLHRMKIWIRKRSIRVCSDWSFSWREDKNALVLRLKAVSLAVGRSLTCVLGGTLGCTA